MGVLGKKSDVKCSKDGPLSVFQLGLDYYRDRRKPEHPVAADAGVSNLQQKGAENAGLYWFERSSGYEPC